MRLSAKVKQDLSKLKYASLQEYQTASLAFAESLNAMFSHYQSVLNQVLTDQQIGHLLFFYHLLGFMEGPASGQERVIPAQSIHFIINDYLVRKRIPIICEESSIKDLAFDSGLKFSFDPENKNSLFIDQREVL